MLEFHIKISHFSFCKENNIFLSSLLNCANENAVIGSKGSIIWEYDFYGDSWVYASLI